MTVKEALRITESHTDNPLTPVHTALAKEVRRLQDVNDGLHVDLAESAATIHNVQVECSRALKTARERYAELHAVQDERDALASDLAVVKAARDSATQELMKEYKTRCLVQKEFDRLAALLPGDLQAITAERDALSAKLSAMVSERAAMAQFIGKVMAETTGTLLRQLYYSKEQV